jgi:hypothetical protein
MGKLAKITLRPLTPPIDRRNRPLLLIKPTLEDAKRTNKDYMEEGLLAYRAGLYFENLYKEGKAPEVKLTDKARDAEEVIAKERSERRPEEKEDTVQEFTPEQLALPSPPEVQFSKQIWDRLDTFDNSLEWKYVKFRKYAINIATTLAPLYRNSKYQEFVYGYNGILMNLMRVHSEYLLTRDLKTINAIGDRLVHLNGKLKITDAQCERDPVLERNLVVLSASRGTDVMITDYMKGRTLILLF